MRPLHSLLRHKVILQEKQSTGDGMGGSETSWQDVATLWAEISSLRASEASSLGQVSASHIKKFRVRHLSSVTPQMRLMFDGAFYNIRSIRDVEEKKHLLEIIAETGVA